jgi:Predicted exporters of the RND superfamily
MTNRKTALFAVIFFIILAALSVAGVYFIYTQNRFNGDIIEYFGEGYETRKGLDFISEKFGFEGDALFAVEGEENDADLYRKLDEIAATDGVKLALWAGTIERAAAVAELFEGVFGDVVEPEELLAYLKRPSGAGKCVYLVFLLHSFKPSSTEAFALLDRIEATLSPREAVFAGMTATARDITRKTLAELPYYILISALAAAVILFLTGKTRVEPIAVLSSLGAGAVLNAGTNFGQVSIVAFAASAIVQVASAINFSAIFFHYLNKYKGDGVERVAIKTFAAAAPVCLASAGALFSLAFMKFGLGEDLALSLIKAVFISFVTSVIFLPALVSLFGKRALKERKFGLNFEGKLTPKPNILILIFIFVLFIPSFISSYFVKTGYFSVYEKRTETAAEIAAADLEGSLIVAVPLIPKAGAHKEYIAELESLGSVRKAVGLFSAVNLTGEQVDALLKSTSLFEISGTKGFFADDGGVSYTLYAVTLAGSPELNSGKAYADISAVTGKYFESSYKFGLLSAAYDLNGTTMRDFRTAAAAAFLAIFLILFLTAGFKKALPAAFLSALGVGINLSVSAAIGEEINFFGARHSAGDTGGGVHSVFH